MSNKTEILYDLVFKSVKRILTQFNLYKLQIESITTDSEIALINSVNNNFENSKRIWCWFHLNQDLIREAKTIELLNKKNENINIDSTNEVITQLSILPLNYKGDIEYIKSNISILLNQYPKYNNYIINYFLDAKLKYFIDGSYDYSKFPPDIRSNSVLERYNKEIKLQLGEKRTCNWVKFMNFINNEILRINTELGKNENINILFEEKNTKFGKSKFIKDSNQLNKLTEEDKTQPLKIIKKIFLSSGWSNTIIIADIIPL